MTITKEYRIVLPLSVEEYQIGQLYSVVEASKQETGGGEGVEILKNEPFHDVPLFGGAFTSGQYTHKIYHLKSKVPKFLHTILPAGGYDIYEEAWNAYPYCKTVLTNPGYMGDKFLIKIETIHLNDRGTTENAHNLSFEELKARRVIHIDIANDEYLARSDIHPETAPYKFKSIKTGRGPLVGDWRNSSLTTPMMCAYKLVSIYFKWFGFQNIVENFGHKTYPRLFSKFHREVFVWIDKWIDLTLTDIREIEEKARKELEEARRSGEVKGMTA